MICNFENISFKGVSLFFIFREISFRDSFQNSWRNSFRISTGDFFFEIHPRMPSKTLDGIPPRIFTDISPWTLPRILPGISPRTLARILSRIILDVSLRNIISFGHFFQAYNSNLRHISRNFPIISSGFILHFILEFFQKFSLEFCQTFLLNYYKIPSRIISRDLSWVSPEILGIV